MALDAADGPSQTESLTCPDPITTPVCPDGSSALVFDAFSASDPVCGKGTALIGAQGEATVAGCTLSIAAEDTGSYESSQASCTWEHDDEVRAFIVHATVQVGDGSISIRGPGALFLQAYDQFQDSADNQVFWAGDTEIPADRPWLRIHALGDGTATVDASSDGATWTTYSTRPLTEPLTSLQLAVTCEASQGLTCYETRVNVTGAVFVCP